MRIANWTGEKTLHKQGLCHQPFEAIEDWQQCPREQMLLVCSQGSNRGLKSREDFKEIGIELASKGGEVCVGTEREGIPWPEVQQRMSTEAFKETVYLSQRNCAS